MRKKTKESLDIVWLLKEINVDSEGLESLRVFKNEAEGKNAFLQLLKEDMEEAYLLPPSEQKKILELVRKKKYEAATKAHMEKHIPIYISFSKQELE